MASLLHLSTIWKASAPYLVCSKVLTLSADEGTAHALELSKLAEKDPEFYKYLQEHDRELLEFDLNRLDEDDEDEDQNHEQDEDVEMDGEKLPVLTNGILRGWQKALLEVGVIFEASDFG